MAGDVRLHVDSAIRVQNLNKTVCISHSAPNTVGKGMTPTILSPALGNS